MHSYQRSKNGWSVFFDYGVEDSNPYVLREFKHERQAIEFTNYLNGCSLDAARLDVLLRDDETTAVMEHVPDPTTEFLTRLRGSAQAVVDS